MYKFYRYLYKSHTITILLFGVCVPLVINFLFNVIWNTEGTHNFSKYTTTILYFILIVLIAPFFETLISQYVPLKIAGWFIDKHKYIYCYTIIGMAIFFGLMHVKSPLYIIIAFFYGLTWSFCCLLFIRRKQHPIFFTALIHGCYNGILFGLTLLVDSIYKIQ
jgi:hypothetical protein